MLKKSLTLLSLVVLLWLAGSGPAVAQFQGYCYICGLDAYNQHICELVTSQGPEGGTRCLAYVNKCITQNPCNFWV